MKGNSAIVIGVFGALTYDVIAAACSSPQTTEINADKRADTLMKWVYIGIGQAALFVVIAAYIDAPHRKAILVGGILAAGLMYAQYVHAKQAGLASDAPATEY